jgi:RNA polymerase sigma-70 factor (ECF subfamily)
MRSEIAEAVRVVQQKRPEALEHALALLQDTVMAYSMKVCGQREDAEDTAQEVLLRTARYLPQFDSPMALSVWLYKVARSQCMMKRRRSKYAPAEELPMEALLAQVPAETKSTGPGISPEEFLIKVESAERILAAIRELPEQYRTIITLHDLEELDTAQVARAIEISEGAVRVRLHRARKMLREHLEAAEVPVPL